MLNARTFTEEELLDRLSKRDPMALQELIHLYFPILCQFAERFLPDSALAKDIVQETFINFWNAKGSFETLPGLKGFLYTATRNGCLNLLRSIERRENRHLEAYGRMPATTEPIHTELVYAESIALIYQIVRTLSPAMQEIFFLSYEEGLTVSEIAARLNMNLKTVKNHKYKVLLLLRARLGNRGGSLLVLLTFLLK